MVVGQTIEAGGEEIGHIVTVLLIANLLTFLGLAVGQHRAARWANYSALGALLIAGTQMFVERPRWQLIPAYTLTGLFFLAVVLRNIPLVAGLVRQQGIQRLAVGFTVFGILVSTALPLSLPIFRFPQPGGLWDIGTLTYHLVDARRPEAFNVDSSSRRELMVQVWYPAKRVTPSRLAAYVPDSDIVGPALARVFHLPEMSFAHLKYVATNAQLSVPVSDEEDTYPILVLFEGLNGFRQMNTYQVEWLVSHGYIVAAIDQPYVAAAVVFPDGRQIAGLSKDQLSPLIQQSLSPAASAPTLNGTAFADGVIPYLAQDASFTLDQLAAINNHDPNGILTGRLDLQHTGALGVSLGGVVVGEACRLDPRFRACLVMDAPMTTDVVRGGLRQPIMFITRDANTMRLERQRAGGWSEADITQHQTTMRAVFQKALPGSGYFVQVPGMFQANLMDIPYWSPLFSQLGVTGPIDAQRTHDIVNEYSLDFFDGFLRDDQAPLLAGPSKRFPDVLFESR